MSSDGPAGRFTLTLRGPRVVYGAGVAGTELAAELDLLGAERVLVLASAREHAARAAVLDPVAGRIVGHHPDVRRHVPRAAAERATAAARHLEADCLLSVGGGSATGTAKAVALETGLPILALPTTYAGSELTPVIGITDGRVKRTGRSERVLPRTVLLDPDLAAGLPGPLARHSAVNALAHCVGGLFAAGRSPVTDLLALEGARFLAAGLRSLAADPGSTAAREALLQGAHLAGTVLAHAGTSAHHTACHVLGGGFDLPHAETHAALLPASCAFLQERDPVPATRLATALGATDLAAGVHDLLGATGSSVALRDLGLARPDLADAAELLAEGVDGLDRVRARRLLEDAC